MAIFYLFIKIHDPCTYINNYYSGNKDLSIYDKCEDNYYIEYQDEKSKSNIEDNKFKYCKEEDNICYKFIKGHEQEKHNKYSKSKKCDESDNGNYIECLENNYLAFKNIFTGIEQCIYSEYFECVKFKENFIYDITPGVSA